MFVIPCEAVDHFANLKILKIFRTTRMHEVGTFEISLQETLIFSTDEHPCLESNPCLSDCLGLPTGNEILSTEPGIKYG